MRCRAILSLTASFTGLSLFAASGVRPQCVPDLMTTYSGEKIISLSQWENVRVPEIKEKYEREVFGKRPKQLEDLSRTSFSVIEQSDAMNGAAVRKIVRIDYLGPNGKFSFPVTVFIPKSTVPVPAFVFICNRPAKNIDPTRVVKSPFWPAEEIVSRGFATAAFLFSDVAADDAKAGWNQGIFAVAEDAAMRDGSSWGAISAWAWAASRVMDWICTERTIDSSRVGVVGHSRGGKTAIWAGVCDKRFAMVCSNNSGCSGAKLNHIKLPKSESIGFITKTFPHWFCSEYFKYSQRDMRMDFDQHHLLALVSPRLLCVTSATKDAWAGPEGEWWSAKLASPAWELYGKRGLTAAAFPEIANSPQQEGCISYHIREGKHDLTPFDWGVFMDFADKHWGKRFVVKAPDGANTLSEEEMAQGWELIWNGKNLDGWLGVKNRFACAPTNGWHISEGVLSTRPEYGILPDGKWYPLDRSKRALGGGGDIVSVQKFKDFAFKFNFLMTARANSGVKYFYDEKQNKGTCEEYQILEPSHPDYGKGRGGNRKTASLYDLFPANADKFLKSAGSWNSGMIVSKGTKVEHWLNGQKVLEYDRSADSFKKAVEKSKYAKWGVSVDGKTQPWGEIAEGRILIQDHGDSEVYFCNMKIKKL